MDTQHNKPGYWRCKGTLQRLRKFQDLVRHRERWAHDIENAQPLQALLPKGSDISKSNDKLDLLIEKQINRLIPVMRSDLSITGISARARVVVHVSKRSGGKSYRDVDIVLNYLDEIFEAGRMSRYQLLMQYLERNIGWFEERKRRAKLEAVNPLHWLARTARLPVTVLELAGLITQKEHSKFVTVYAWLLKAVFLIILVLVATKLGISIPWEMIKPW